LNKSYRAFKNLTLLTQLAISLLTPIIMCIFRCTWLKNKFGLGNWIIIFGILFGLGSGLLSVWKFMVVFQRESDESQKEYEDQFR